MSYLNRLSSSAGSGISRFTGSILPSVASALQRKQNMMAKNFVIGKPEKPLLTQRMIRAPHAYVPGGTKKNLDHFAKEVLHDQKSFDKRAVAFAKGYAHPAKEIKKENEQRHYLEGEAEALVATHDRSVKTPYDMEHHANAVALHALRSEQKVRAEPVKPTQMQRLAAAGINQQNAPRPYDRPWRTDQATTAAAVAPHAKDLHTLGSMSTGALRFGGVHIPRPASPTQEAAPTGLASMTPAETQQPAPQSPAEIVQIPNNPAPSELPKAA